MIGKIAGVVFDMDGLLVDSEPLWQETEMRVFGELGVDLTPDRCKETQGLRIDEVVSYWYSRMPWDDGVAVSTVAERIQRGLEQRLAEHARPLPGAVLAPRAAVERGLKCAVASSSPKSLIEAAMRSLALDGVFSSLHSASDCAYGKPHPEVYLAAARALGVSPAQCVAVEDSVTGLISCRAAGMVTVAVPDKEHAEDPRFSIAHYQLPSLERLPELLDQLAKL